MKKYNVTGMSCAACQARVEQAVGKIEGVTSCSVSLLTNTMAVEGNVSSEDIINAVKRAGYDASDANNNKSASFSDNSTLDNQEEINHLKSRLISSICFLIMLMYLSMGHSMFGLPIPSQISENPVANGLLQMILSAIILIINQKFFISGFKGLIHKAPNMDTLVSLGSGASFAYSTAILFIGILALGNGDISSVEHLHHQLYFESAAMILTLISVGKLLEAKSKGRTTDALKSLMNLSPKTALLLRDGLEVEVPVDQVEKDDIFVVKPGHRVPVDGLILEGNSALDESSITGESIPVDKGPGDKITSATINQSGYLKCQATRVGEDTTLSQIIQLVSDTAATKAPIAKIADKVSGVFVPVVISLALLVTVGWILVGKTFGFALARGICVLVISCPCALGLATPVAIMVGNGLGAKNGILFKTAVSLEKTGISKIVVLDKTGTITEGNPKVTDLLPADHIDKKHLLQVAYSLERKSEHPLAKAIVAYGEENCLESFEITDFKALPGNGLSGQLGAGYVAGGNLAFIESKIYVPLTLKRKAAAFSEEGKTPLYFIENDKLLGIIAVADVIKKDSTTAVSQLKNMGIKVVMLTGDNEKTANAIGKIAGVDQVIAEVLPDGKKAVIDKLKLEGEVIMVGDGINDAPALTAAHTGIAIGAGTDIAMDAADIVLMKNTLLDVPAAIRLSRKTLKNIKENLFWAFIYNICGIPLAAGLFIPLFGLEMNPMFGAAAMSLSSFCVVSNALRINMFNIYDDKKDKQTITKTKKGIDTMEKTMTIEGMMCPHCTGRVEKVLGELEGVTSVTASFETGLATLTLTEEISDDLLRKTVEDQGYPVLDIK